MTGQLFVVPASLPIDPYERLAFSLDDGRSCGSATCASSGGSGCTCADDDPFDGIGPEPLDDAVHAQGVPVADPRPPGRLKPLLVDQGVRRGRRQHLRGRGPVALEAPPAPVRPLPPPARRAAPCTATSARSSPRRSIRRGSSIDDYTAPDGDGAMQERLDVYQRTGEPCRRCGRPIRRIVVGIRATHFCSWCQRLPAAQRPAAAPAAAHDDAATAAPPRRARKGRRWIELDGEGALGRTTDEAARPGPARHARRRRPRPAGGGAARAGERLVSLVRLDGVVREIGTFVILDRIDGRDRARRAGRARRARTAPARRRCCGSWPGRDEPDRGKVGRAARPQRSGCSARRRTSTRRSWPRRTCGRRCATAPRTSSAWPSELARARARRPRRRDRTTRTSSTGSTSSAATRSTSASTRRCPASGSPATSGCGRRPRCPAASRRARRSPASSSPTRTCCCSTSRRTTSTSARSSGSRSTSGADPARCSSRRTTARSSTRPSTRVWELRDRRLTVFRGDYTAYHRQRVERDERAERGGREPRRTRSQREIELVQRYRSQRKHVKMHEHEARLEKLKARGARGAQEVRAGRSGSTAPRSRAARSAPASSWSASRTSPSATCPGRGALAPDGTEAAEPRDRRAGPVPRRAARRADRDRRAERGRQDDAAADDRRRPARRSTGSSRSATRCSPATSPSCATRRSPARRSSTRSSRRSRSRPARRAATSPGSCSAATTRSRRSGSLSGGERSRLELALLGILPSNLLLLDEPTNHLDIAAREAIEAFLAESPATLLVVSHDRRLLETICERLWVVDDGDRRAVRRRLPGLARRRSRTAGPCRPRRSGAANRVRPGAVAAATAAASTTRPRPGPASAAPDAGRSGASRPRRRPPGRRPSEAVEGRVPAPAGGARRGARRGSGCARASWSWRWARRP